MKNLVAWRGQRCGFDVHEHSMLGDVDGPIDDVFGRPNTSTASDWKRLYTDYSPNPTFRRRENQALKPSLTTRREIYNLVSLGLEPNPKQV